MVLRHVSILRDILREYVCTLLKSLDYLKDFKNYLVQRMAPQGSQHTPATVLLPQRRN